MRNTQINHHVNIAGIASIFFFGCYIILLIIKKNDKEPKKMRLEELEPSISYIQAKIMNGGDRAFLTLEPI